MEKTYLIWEAVDGARHIGKAKTLLEAGQFILKWCGANGEVCYEQQIVYAEDNVGRVICVGKKIDLRAAINEALDAMEFQANSL